MSFNRQLLQQRQGPTAINRVVTQVAADYVMQPNDDVVIEQGAGHVVSLPPTPLLGDVHEIIAEGGATTVSGNGRLINGGASLGLIIADQATCTFNGTVWDATIANPNPSGGGGGLANVILANGLNSNVATQGQAVVRVGGPTAAYSIDGFQLPIAPAGGDRFVLVNTVNFPLSIIDNGAGSAAGNKIETLRGPAVVLPKAGSSCAFVFDSTANKWALEHAGTVQQPRKVDVRDFGADPTGTLDSTNAIQNAINFLAAIGSSGQLFFAAGLYLVSTPLTYTNTGPSNSIIHFEGELYTGGGQNSGACIRWTGGNQAGALLTCNGATGITIERLAIVASNDNGVTGCQFGVWIQEGAPAVSTEDVMLRDVTIYYPVGADSACLAIGTAAGADVEQIHCEHCQFNGLGSTQSGVRILGTGNTKNFKFSDCTFRAFSRSGIRWDLGQSGTCTLEFCVMAACGVTDIEAPSAQCLTVRGMESEGGHRPLYQSGAASGGQANVTFLDCAWSLNASDDHLLFGGAFVNATQDVAVWCIESFVTIGCTYWNIRTANSESQIHVNVDGPNGSLTSIGNTYVQSHARFPPFYDTSGNFLPFGGAFAELHDLPVFSRGDYGSQANGGNPAVLFPSYEGANVGCGRQALTDDFRDAAVPLWTYLSSSGIPMAKVTLTFANWQIAALTNTLRLADFQKKTRVIAVVADTTIAYAGLAGTISLEVGNVGTLNLYLLSHDVKTAPVRKGDLNADYGTSLAAASGRQFGYVTSYTTTDELTASLISSVGNLSGLNAGSTDFYVIFQVMP